MMAVEESAISAPHNTALLTGRPAMIATDATMPIVPSIWIRPPWMT
jgi:hypothetical protein